MWKVSFLMIKTGLLPGEIIISTFWKTVSALKMELLTTKIIKKWWVETTILKCKTRFLKNTNCQNTRDSGHRNNNKVRNLQLFSKKLFKNVFSVLACDFYTHLTTFVFILCSLKIQLLSESRCFQTLTKWFSSVN